ncbi:hypothetical protein FBUS_00889 [Fasciolopsis buskii]|uniref:Uncharacterized protein n=1 Tax=Fasciolopsis buskii TaxID=27845 RepID=A0A8E0VI36_9TREM|nr:hypothetical protein FBUS_00889 [Fasciolopsis buski]
MILGYPEWPAMVDCDSTGRYADYDEQTGEVIRYFVVFLDPKTPTRQRIQAAKIRKFISIAEVKQIRTWARYYTRLLLAAREAENALTLPLEVGSAIFLLLFVLTVFVGYELRALDSQ